MALAFGDFTSALVNLVFKPFMILNIGFQRIMNHLIVGTVHRLSNSLKGFRSLGIRPVRMAKPGVAGSYFYLCIALYIDCGTTMGTV